MRDPLDLLEVVARKVDMPATEELEEATATWELDEAGEKAWGGALPHPPHPKPTAAVATRRVAACRCRVDRERAVARLKGAPPHPLEFLSPTQPPVAAGVAPTLGRPPPARANARARAGHSGSQQSRCGAPVSVVESRNCYFVGSFMEIQVVTDKARN
uniref:Uncharacterized protein n=1 Tax=Oryza rufipogon TaxID=4529 RepID=A0A0E0QRK0_ORYRU